MRAGEVVALIGANGAGKTSTMRVITGLLRPRRGRVLFEGAPIERLSPHRIATRGIALVPEGRRIFRGMTVEENLELGALKGRLLYGGQVDVETAYAVFPLLRERRAQFAGTLSGGEQQMLALGRALVSRPRLLLLDEPSLGLAPLVVRQIFQVIERIHAGGTTILLVEQNANLALQVANRAYVLQNGRMVLEGSPAALRENPVVRRAYLGGHS